MKNQMKKNRSGFTLIELMVTVTVVAILVMVAVPSLLDFFRKNAVQGDQRKRAAGRLCAPFHPSGRYL